MVFTQRFPPSYNFCRCIPKLVPSEEPTSLWTTRNKLIFDSTRNKLIFDSRSTTPQKVVVQSICAMREWESAQLSLPSAALKQLPPTPPPIIPTATIFCNTDAAWKSDSNSAGLAWIFSDQSGLEIARSSSAQDHVASPCMAEAIAIRDALLHAASLNYSHICLRTDSQVIAQAINKRSSTMELYGLLSNIDSLIFSTSSPFVFCFVVFIPRTANGPADQLEKAQFTSHLGVSSRAWLAHCFLLLIINIWYWTKKKKNSNISPITPNVFYFTEPYCFASSLPKRDVKLNYFVTYYGRLIFQHNSLENISLCLVVIMLIIWGGLV